MTQRSPFRYFRTSPEIIRLAVMMYVRFPLSLRTVEDLLHERGIEVSHETVRSWWLHFGPIFASEIRRKRVSGMRASRWRWHLDEVFVKINGVQHYLGGLWTTKARFWRRSSQGHGTRRPPCSSCVS
jgi:putative transposase